MSNKSIRINTTIDESTKFINVNLEQDFDTLDILSVKLSQSDIYRTFQANYGCLIGRIQSKNVGLPNVKVSVFIAISDDDMERPEIKEIYNYTTTSDKNRQNRRYNLLSTLQRLNPFSGFKENRFGLGYNPKTPVGDIPDKIELLSNDTYLEVYKKYYKYTTVTNNAGDYMIMGVPTGAQTLHIDCDITDIGRFSTPAPLLKKLNNLSDDLFTDNGTLIKKSNDLDNLPNIHSKDIAVDVKPFWEQTTEGTNNNVVTITRKDVDLNIILKPAVTIFGSSIAMPNNSWWFDLCIFRLYTGFISKPCWQGIAVGWGDELDEIKKTLATYKRDCKKAVQIELPIRYCFGFRVSLGNIGGNNIGFTLGNPPSGSNFCFSIAFGFYIRINIVPFLKIESPLFNNYRNAKYRINGGKTDLNPIDYYNYGRTCKCTEEEALLQIPSEDLTDKLDLKSMVPANTSFTIFNIKKEINDNLLDLVKSGSNTNDNAYQLLNFNEDIEKLDPENYVEFKEEGMFYHIIPCNRRKVVTNEFGDLIDVDINSDKGVFSEYRGYYYVYNNTPTNNPFGSWRTGTVRMKIPSTVKYIPSNPNKWIWEHFTFSLGEVYSVAQLMATRRFDMFCNDEKSFSGDIIGIGSGLGYFDEKKGWDMQTGLLLNVEEIYSNEELLNESKMFANSVTCLFEGEAETQLLSSEQLNSIYQLDEDDERFKEDSTADALGTGVSVINSNNTVIVDNGGNARNYGNDYVVWSLYNIREGNNTGAYDVNTFIYTAQENITLTQYDWNVGVIALTFAYFQIRKNGVIVVDNIRVGPGDNSRAFRNETWMQLEAGDTLQIFVKGFLTGNQTLIII